MDYRWTTLMADYILDVCSGATAGPLQLVDFVWETLGGRLYMGDFVWETLHGRLWVVDFNWVTLYGPAIVRYIC